MINLETIKNPEYKFNNKNVIIFQYETSEGATKTAFLTVPAEDEHNREYDYIIEKFGVDYLNEQHDKVVEHAKKRHELDKLKREGAKEADELAALFKQKAEIFKLPFVKNADEDTQSAFRRAPTMQVLNCILAIEMKKYMDENSYDYDTLLDEVDDVLYEEGE